MAPLFMPSEKFPYARGGAIIFSLPMVFGKMSGAGQTRGKCLVISAQGFGVQMDAMTPMTMGAPAVMLGISFTIAPAPSKGRKPNPMADH
jgi:hypothetical protein